MIKLASCKVDTYFNLRCLFNILYSKQEEEAVVISLDAQHAFDQVEWSYMMFALRKFGFSFHFMKWIEIIYSQPSASVITNQNNSPPFGIRRETHQGCPLSHFLFAIAIAIEYLLVASIRQNPLISPIDTFGYKHHLSLYADNILLYVSKPQKSLPVLLALIIKFGNLSGFSINWEKSELMPISTKVDERYLQSVPVKKSYERYI